MDDECIVVGFFRVVFEVWFIGFWIFFYLMMLLMWFFGFDIGFFFICCDDFLVFGGYLDDW